MGCDERAREDDYRLVQKVIAGDPAARDQFVDLYSNLVRKVVSQYVAWSAEEQQDAWQVIFLSLFEDDCRRLRTYRGRARFSTWLFTCARRMCLDYFPAEQRLIPMPAPPATNERKADDVIDRLLKHLALQEALENLSPTDAIIVRLRYERNLSYQRIAEIVHMSVNTVASRLRRAKERLAKAVEDAL